MTSIDFMGRDEPNFYFKGINAAIDMGLIIEQEISEITPKPRVEEIETLGRNGSLHEWHGDYEPYNLTIENVSCLYDQLSDVKRWLRGTGKLITHNDYDKYRTARCNMTAPVDYENQWGYFYSFNISFRCQPFKKRLKPTKIPLVKGGNKLVNSGHEVSKPIFWINATGGDFSIKIGQRTLTILNAKNGIVEINTEFGKVTQDGLSLKKKGSWPWSTPGMNEIILSGSLTGGIVDLEAVYI